MQSSLFFLLRYTIYDMYIFPIYWTASRAIISQCQREMSFCQLPPPFSPFFRPFSNTFFVCLVHCVLPFSSSFFSLYFPDFLWAISFVIKTTIVIQHALLLFLLKGILDLWRWQFLIVVLFWWWSLKVASISSQWVGKSFFLAEVTNRGVRVRWRCDDDALMHG